ncbi:MAG: IS91 family transposase [Oligoflexales bacterium]
MSEQADQKRPSLEIADIFRDYGHLLGPLGPDQAKVVSDIQNCRTSVLGGHISQCQDCSHKEISYNSCRNRHCPKCQFLAKIDWVEARTNDLLPCQYFHCVFTLPHELNPIILQNKEIVFNILFRAVAATLKEAAKNPKNLGAEVGFTSVLHTWSQNLLDHFHLHVIIPGGGLSEKRDKWISCREKFLLPVKVLSKLFRGKFLALFKKAFDEFKFIGRCEVYQNFSSFNDLISSAYDKQWVVYAKPPFSGPEDVIKYLGSYTHRIAISNYRLVKVEDNKVHFFYRDAHKKDEKKTMSLEIKEFMRRFLLHVVPKGFMRIRHYGILSGRSKGKLIKLCRELIPEPIDYKVFKKIESENWIEKMIRVTGHDPLLCPSCKKGQMIPIAEIKSHWDTS